MKINIVAYVDANYLPKFLICYESLQKHLKDFTLHLFCFDDVVYNILKRYNFPNVILYSQKEFEDQKAASKKDSKKSYEYYWTYTPIVLQKIMKDVKDNELVVYMDTDMMFFSSPMSIFNQLEDKDVLIQPNNFSVQERWQFDPIGYYCTAFNVFRNNDNTRQIVNNWYNECIKWCGADFTTGAFGDQKYMDFWLQKYDKVREVTLHGANVAPWNIQKYDVSSRNGEVFINTEKLIYYHYHAFKMSFDTYDYMIEGDRDNHYEISNDAVKHIYTPYISNYIRVLEQLKQEANFREYIKLNPKGNVGWYDKNQLGRTRKNQS